MSPKPIHINNNNNNINIHSITFFETNEEMVGVIRNDFFENAFMVVDVVSGDFVDLVVIFDDMDFILLPLGIGTHSEYVFVVFTVEGHHAL